MKIGIVTFQSAHNYGAVLQAWSLQEYLEQQGHTVEIVNLRLNVIDKLYRMVRKPKRNVCRIKWINEFVKSSIYWSRVGLIMMKQPKKCAKFVRFESFIHHKLHTTQESNTLVELRKQRLSYDVLIAGSDQIWNSKMMSGINPAYFLQFANKDCIRFSYAASIGTNRIPDQYKILFQRYLRELDSISVRENNAKSQIEKLTDREIDVVPDPTFLLEQKDFDKLKKKPHYRKKYIYVHNVHLVRVDKALNAVAEEMSKRLNLPIVHNRNEHYFSQELAQFNGGVGEFIGAVAGAEYVITNSFHCTVFALIYQKNFITVPHFQHPDRMKNLLAELSLDNHLIGSAAKIPANLEELAIDYEAVTAKRAKMGQQGKDFIQYALVTKKPVDKRDFFDTGDKFRCYGCHACENICPVDAITMTPDEEGFSYPQINEELCIHCNRCKKVCIYHNKKNKNAKSDEFPKVYAAVNKDKAVVEASTSGGMFTPMYEKMIASQGKVVGVQYNKEMEVVYDIADTTTQCEKFRGSKYVFANSGTMKSDIKDLLERETPVLYVGTPCEIAGLNSFLGKDYPLLVTVELICNSAISPKVFRLYCDFLEDLYKSKIVSFQFRNKFKSIADNVMKIEFESKSIEMERSTKNNLYRAFANGHIQRPSCYTCEFSGLKSGVADITIGDFWGVGKFFPDFVSEKGISILKINTAKGNDFVDLIKDNYELRESNFKDAYEANKKQSITMMPPRGRIMHYLDEKPIDGLLLTFNRRKKGKIPLN